MPEVIFPGPDGRLEGRIQPKSDPASPIAIILHPHPLYGGTMNNKVVYALYQVFAQKGFTVLRFNFRGVGRSQGKYDSGVGELSDAAAALDWLQATYPNARTTWVAGFSFGAWIGMQLLMRRPEIGGFISVSPPANMFDFSFLAPCPSSGLILHGTSDQIVPGEDVDKLNDKLSQQKGITITYQKVRGADHFYSEKMEEMANHVGRYLDNAMAPSEAA